MNRLVFGFIFSLALHMNRGARTTYYQTFDQLVRSSGSQSSSRSKAPAVDKEKKYRASLQHSLSDKSFSNASTQHAPRKHNQGTLNADRKSLGTLGSKADTYGSIGATTRSLETASTRGTFSNASLRGPPANQQTVIVQTGGGNSISKLLNSEAAKSAGAAFGSATAAMVAKGIESRFSKDPHPSPTQHAYPPAGFTPCAGYCR